MPRPPFISYDSPYPGGGGGRLEPLRGTNPVPPGTREGNGKSSHICLRVCQRSPFRLLAIGQKVTNRSRTRPNPATNECVTGKGLSHYRVDGFKANILVICFKCPIGKSEWGESTVIHVTMNLVKNWDRPLFLVELGHAPDFQQVLAIGKGVLFQRLFPCSFS